MISGWLMHLVPWWGWLLLAAVVIGALWRLLGWRGALAAAGGFLAVLAYGKGRNDAFTERDAAEARRRAEAIKDRKETDDEIDQLGSNDVDDRLARWLRDDDR